MPPYTCDVDVCLLDSVISGLDPCKDLVPPLTAVCKSVVNNASRFFSSHIIIYRNFCPPPTPLYLYNKHNRLSKRQQSTIKFHSLYSVPFNLLSATANFNNYLNFSFHFKKNTKASCECCYTRRFITWDGRKTWLRRQKK